MKLKTKTPEGFLTTNKERKSYYLYFCGQNMIYTMVVTFLTTYLLFQGVDPVYSASVMLIVKVWDAVNDAIFGCIFDKIKFKSKQKFIPWLKISLPLIPIATILLYFIPGGASQTVKLAWFAIFYLLWDTAYTFCDVPIYGIVTAMTDNLNERTSLLSYKSIWAGAGTAVTTVIATLLPSQNVGLPFSLVAIIVGVLAFVTMFPMCKNGQERFVTESEEDFTVIKMFKYLISNKYLLIYYFGFFFQSGFNVINSLNLLVSYYLFHNEVFSLLVGAVAVVPSLIFSLIVPKLIAKFDKRTVFLASNILAIVLGIVIWLVGYKSMILFTVLTVIRAVPLAIQGVMLFMFTPDCAEYGKFKTGTDAKGITFAIQTFMAKITAAISTTLGLFMLGLFKWKNVEAESFQELAALGVEQSEFTLNGLWFTYAMVPTIGLVLAGIIWHFYRLKDNDVKVMIDCNNGKISKEDAMKEITSKL